MRSQLRRKAIEISLVAVVVGGSAAAGLRLVDNNILIVPGQDKEAEQKILIVPGEARSGSTGGAMQASHDSAVGHAAGAPAPARHAAPPSSANHQQQLDRSGARQTGTERGDGPGTRH